jgi:PEGA domain-containing protein
VPANDHTLNQGDELTSAAHAAASWVRARRAQWTSAPVALAAAPASDRPMFDPVFDAFVPDPPISAPIVSAPIIPTPAPGATPRRTVTLDPATRRWLARGAIAAAVVASAAVAGPRLWLALPARPVRTAPAPLKPSAAIAKKPAGSLRVGSTPPGARVLVDGKARGVTPVNLTDLSPGRHEIALQSDAGSVTRTVTVAANTTTAIDEAIFSGFVTVYAPFDVTVSEGGRVLRADDHHQIMLAPGAHELRVTNRSLAYDAVRRIVVEPGESTNLQLTPDPSTLTVTASEAAEVWVDGTRLGDTPLTAAPIPLGIHELVVRRAAGGERHFTVTIGAKPFALAVDF